MHQSPQKQPSRRRDKYLEFDLSEPLADRRLYREASPKARKFPLREDSQRELRGDKQYSEK